MSDQNTNTELNTRFYESYTKPIIKQGRVTTLIAGLLTFLPALYLWLALDIRPTWGEIGQGWMIVFSSFCVMYFLEPLGYFPIMGLSGVYIGYLAGNIPSVRFPAMVSAQVATGCPAGTKKGELVGTIAIGMSVFVNLIFVTLAAVTGAAILNILPEFVINAFNYTLPAILGAVIAQYFKTQKKLIFIMLIVCVVLLLLPIPSAILLPLTVIISGLLGYVLYQRTKMKETTE